MTKRIDYIITEVTKGVELVAEILKTDFNISQQNAEWCANIKRAYFDVLKDNCWLFVESPYVDRVYRDSYYNYYSSKLTEYKRDCVRISIFNCKIDIDDFRNPNKLKDLRHNYLGFIIIRPTYPFIIGRSTISPKALKNNNFKICCATIQSTVNSIKFEVEGFPNSSQDTETISCAETTLWAIMEYFGNKYPHYRPVLPSKIIETLNKITTERQIPSKGLNIQQMSFALKAFGFGTRIYSNGSYGIEFKKLYSCYIESGIPLVVAIDNIPPGNIGHAIICIGYEEPLHAQIDTLLPNQMDLNLKIEFELKGINIFDWDDLDKTFIYIDDNQPAYQKATFNAPTNHYPDTTWHKCEIKSFIAPMYSKIYLEAYEAKKYLLNYFLVSHQPLANNSNVLVRFFLTSSRSYKNALALNSSFDATIKNLILNMSMPKFIWVAELSDKDKIKDKKADGLLILDATEANIYATIMIFTAYQGEIRIFDNNSGIPSNYSLPLTPFNIYENNLKTV